MATTKKPKPPKIKEWYRVYAVYKNGFIRFLSETRAVSPAQAANHVRWRHFGETSKDDLKLIEGIELEAAPYRSEALAEIVARKKRWEQDQEYYERHGCPPPPPRPPRQGRKQPVEQLVMFG